MTDLTIENRLDALPNRVRVAFQRLLDVKQIDDETLNVVLDASELAGGDTNRSLGFAIGYQYLKSIGVPVKDVISMAKQQQRRIKLNWSAKRWKEEHDRLARAETLKRLAAANVAYDLTEYAALLPAHFDGYLIGSSRRLGMEGLRQRHCVATYHDGIAAGRYAFAAVFIDSKRWTVQLRHRTDESGDTLQIVTAHSRFNECANGVVMRHIHDMLGLVEVKSAQASTRADETEQRHYLRSLQAVLPVLQAHAIHSVSVNFDGCGDSGSIDEIIYYRMSENGIVTAIENTDEAFDGSEIQVVLTVPRINWDINAGTWDRVFVDDTVSLDDAITELSDDYIESTGVDWYNDDGGYGQLHIHVDSQTVELEVNSRYTRSECEFDETIDIRTGEVI